MPIIAADGTETLFGNTVYEQYSFVKHPFMPEVSGGCANVIKLRKSFAFGEDTDHGAPWLVSPPAGIRSLNLMTLGVVLSVCLWQITCSAAC
jgi:hypothetical protein